MFCNVTLIGNLGANPEIRTTSSGRRVANLRVAVTETWKDKAGEKRERTTWHRVEVWSQGAVKAIETCLAKGSKVHVEGALRYRGTWTDQQGVAHPDVRIVVEAPGHKVLFLTPRPAANQAAA